MFKISQLFVLVILLLMTPLSFAAPMSSTESKQWLQEALHYGFDMKTEDYTKYISTDYIEHIDGKVFSFEQWAHHMQELKKMMQSYKLTFDEIVVEQDQIATSYVVHATKKDGKKLDIRIIAIFKIKDNKMVYCDELTHILSGEASADLPSKS